MMLAFHPNRHGSISGIPLAQSPPTDSSITDTPNLGLHRFRSVLGLHYSHSGWAGIELATVPLMLDASFSEWDPIAGQSIN